MGRTVLVLWMLVTLSQAGERLPDTPIVSVTTWETDGLAGWEVKAFHGRTNYRLVQEADTGQWVVHALGRGTASGLVRSIHVDLKKTPWMHWQWKVDKALKGLDERSRQGDDYVARVYVVASGPFFWQTRAISYVWSGSELKGASWPNAYAGPRAMMVAVEGASAPTGRWVWETRNVEQDFVQWFGESPGSVDAVAIMTDSDDSRQVAEAWYGEIFFSGSEERQ